MCVCIFLIVYFIIMENYRNISTGLELYRILEFWVDVLLYDF